MKRVTLKDVPDDQLYCMRGGFNHPFEPIANPVSRSRWHRRIVSRCTRCEMERTQLRDIYDRTCSAYYDRPAWHVEITEPFDATDVATEIVRRLNAQIHVPRKTRRLRAV